MNNSVIEPVHCFMIVPVHLRRRWLRRYRTTSRATVSSADLTVNDTRCSAGTSPYDYCNTMIFLDDYPDLIPPDGYESLLPNDVPHDDPRWPTHCDRCGKPFSMTDPFQIFTERLYAKAADLASASQQAAIPLHVVHESLTACYAPPGAMWYSTWNQDHGSAEWKARGGGPHLNVVLPCRMNWDIDMAAGTNLPSGLLSGSLNGSGWTREGEPPCVTANPSILIRNKDGSERFHGWLRNGVITQC